jgi:HK97 family phage major capsid protein/HK97 family phage prohead protease
MSATAVANRAYAVLDWKAVDSDKRVLEGIATTPQPDRFADIIEPAGVEFSLPLPLLFQHESRQPIGQVIEAKVSDDGIKVKAQIAPSGTAGFIDEAWKLIRAGLVRGLSIGFRSLEETFDKQTGGMHFLRTEWIELSVVTIPANIQASVTAIKSAVASPAVSRNSAKPHSKIVTIKPSGVPGLSEGKSMSKPIAETIASFESRRQAGMDKMNAIMAKSGDEGRTLDAAETEEYDGLQADIDTIDKHLVRLRQHEKQLVSSAKAVTPTNTADPDSASRTRSGIITVKSNLPAGTGFTRYAMALATCNGNKLEAAEYAKRWADDTPEVARALKAAMSAGTIADADWAQPLVDYRNLASEFVELLRPQTIIGRIPGIRRVPFNIKLPVQTQGSTVGWVGELKPKPVSELKFQQILLGITKAAGIVVLSEELVRSSTPSAEAIVRADLTAQIAQFLDRQFIDPAVAAVANVNPASITNGVTPIPASGTTADAMRTDIKKLFNAFVSANLNPMGGVWIMTATQANGLAMLQNPLGQPEFPSISVSGGTLFGLPVVVSENMPKTGSPPTISNIILVNAPDILLADDGGVTLDISREASLQMDSAPTDPITATTVLVSLWQINAVGLRAERFINWMRRRLEAVQYISNANYG